MRPLEGGEQVEAGLAELSDPRQVDHPVGREAVQQSVEGSRADVVEGAEHRDPPQRVAVEHEGVMSPLGVRQELLGRGRPAPDDDDPIVWRGFIPKGRPQVLAFSVSSHACALRVEDQVGDELRRLVVERRCHVAVDAERDGDGRVTEPLLHHARMDPAFQRERRPGVP